MKEYTFWLSERIGPSTYRNKVVEIVIDATDIEEARRLGVELSKELTGYVFFGDLKSLRACKIK